MLARVRMTMAEDRALTRAVMAWAVLQLVLALWDLPSRSSWENDGMAPRDVFAGLGVNLTPGQGHRYPLFHYALVAIASLPAWLLALLTAGGLTGAALEQRLLQADVMTLIAFAAKALSVAMGFIAVLTLARIVRRTSAQGSPHNAARFATFFAATSVSVAYYARTTNLDGPALMWTVLALDIVLDIRSRPRESSAGFAVLGALVAAAVATKDQAYGAFALMLPLYLVTRMRAGILPFTTACVLTYGVLSGALVNPTGLLARVRMLTGSNSADWRQYERGAQGLVENLRDLALAQSEFFWPWPIVALAWAGVLLVVWGKAARDRRAALLPLAMGVSSLLAFTLIVARCEHRFALPIGLALACYAGIAAESLRAALRRVAPGAGGALASVVLIALMLPCVARYIEVAATQWGDSRREVEHYLAALPEGSRVEIYGLLVYWPRFDFNAPYRVTHVDRRRMRMPDLEHAALPYGDPRTRDADVLVMPEEFAERYRPSTRAEHDAANLGIARAAFADLAQTDGGRFFGALFNDRLPGYRRVLLAEPAFPSILRRLGLGPVEIHGSTGNRMAVFVREAR